MPLPWVESIRFYLFPNSTGNPRVKRVAQLFTFPVSLISLPEEELEDIPLDFL
jgi:hypothetical protein